MSFPPLKRMSILERRSGDDRAFFSDHWRTVHGGMVAKLPYLASYHQNHIVEEFPHGGASLPGDGLVEQLWRSTAEMQKGYNSPVVGELVADEVNYLGHGSNYAIMTSAALRPAEQGEKLVVAIRHGGDVGFADAVAERAKNLAPHMVRDDIIATIAKPNMLPALPHPLDAFLHLYLADANAASIAGQQLSQHLPVMNAKAAVSVWRVRTATII